MANHYEPEEPHEYSGEAVIDERERVLAALPDQSVGLKAQIKKSEDKTADLKRQLKANDKRMAEAKAHQTSAQKTYEGNRENAEGERADGGPGDPTPHRTEDDAYPNVESD
jgi:uncharacterized protein YgiM (DUF1202 family)